MANPVLAVQISALSRSFREGDRQRHVLRDLDLNIANGEILALRGRSGSGKSTLLNLISGIDIADRGSIRVAGNDLNKLTERDRTLFRRAHIGFVYQAFNLVPTLSVADNIRLVLELNDIARSVANIRIAELLATVRLADRKDSYPDVLSGGEQQRVAIARAIAHEPSLLLADEPTGNLDGKTALDVLELLFSILRKGKGTMIIATHSAEVAARCDRVLELRDGQLSTQ